MNVYPVNFLPGALLSSSHKSEYSNLANLYHPYLKHRCWFDNPGVAILNGEWTEPVEINTFIIADTNAKFKIELFDEENALITEWQNNNPEQINIYELPEAKKVKRFTVAMTGKEESYIGYIFVGKKVVLPRFTVRPEFGTELRSTSGRTSGGQAYGLIIPTLDGISVSYLRIPQTEMEIIKDYVQSVQNVIPHVIDAYPEAHDAVPPMYMTLNSAPIRTKREENTFYWDFELNWQEAR